MMSEAVQQLFFFFLLKDVNKSIIYLPISGILEWRGIVIVLYWGSLEPHLSFTLLHSYFSQ